MFKKSLSILLALIMVLSMGTAAFADTQQSEITVDVGATVMNVTVPTTLPIGVDANGESTGAITAYITNNSAAQVEVTGVEVIPSTDWELKDWSTDWSNATLGTKEFAFKINNTAVPTTGIVDATQFGVIDGNGGKTNFTYEGRIAPQDGTGTISLGNVVFTIGWVEAEEEEEFKLSGEWLWNEQITAPANEWLEQNIYFSYYRWDYEVSQKIMDSMTRMLVPNGEDLYYAYGDWTTEELAYSGDGYWTESYYQLIDFGVNSQVVSEEFYNWFTANASPVELITFYINGEAYQTAKGLSWYDWVGSKYAPDNFYLSVGEVLYTGEDGKTYCVWGARLNIQEEENYTADEY